MSLNRLSLTWCRHPVEPLDIAEPPSRIQVSIAFLYFLFGFIFQSPLRFYSRQLVL